MAAPRLRFRHVLDAGDVPLIRALAEAAGVFTAEEVRVAAAVAETTIDGSETYRWLIAERDGVLAGYTCFDRVPFTKSAFDLYWIAVLPEEMGSGLAQELLERTIKFIRGKRGTQLFAETSSKPAHERARAFYRGAGLEEAARFPDFYDLGDDKLVFRLKV
jgi:ribosomal protein S18 acetylase RimI-like enzyme